MSHDTAATLLWLMLGLSIVLTIAGIGTRVAWPLFLAATLSFAFGIVSIFSIGIFILALALVQLALGISLRRNDART